MKTLLLILICLTVYVVYYLIGKFVDKKTYGKDYGFLGNFLLNLFFVPILPMAYIELAVRKTVGVFFSGASSKVN